MNTKRLSLLGAALLLLLNPEFSTALAQGSLTPPGAPAPTMKSLDQIEPRTPIASVPFTIASPGSYYVTTNLTGASGLSGITISNNNVSLDLNGFALLGVPGSLYAVAFANSQTNDNSSQILGPLITNTVSGIITNSNPWANLSF